MNGVATVIAPMLLSVSSAVLAGSSPAKGPPPQGSPQAAADAWGSIRFLVGDWTGEGSGQPGAGSGSFSFRFDLDRRILVRRDHSEYPAGQGRPVVAHDALMIVYQEPGTDGLAAIYFDNEGHTVHYQVSVVDEGKRVVFLSEAAGAAPRFRLTYEHVADDTLDIKFEIAPPGRADFVPYLSGKATRAAKPLPTPETTRLRSTRPTAMRGSGRTTAAQGGSSGPHS